MAPFRSQVATHSCVSVSSYRQLGDRDMFVESWPVAPRRDRRCCHHAPPTGEASCRSSTCRTVEDRVATE